MARASGVLLLAALIALPAAAQVTTLAPGPIERCLKQVSEDKEPDHPADLQKSGRPGRVKVELVFTKSDAPPAVRVLESEGGDEFVDAVKARVARYRTPCIHLAEIPTRVVQEYVFNTQGGQVSWHDLDADDAAERQRLLACQVKPDDARTAPYPLDALQARVQGRVLVVATHVAPDLPPEVVGYAVGGAARLLVSDAEDRARKFRIPCLGGKPLRTVVTFEYRFADVPHFGFGKTPFTQFVAAMKPIHREGVDIDTHAMSCPFDVSLNYRQPLLPNEVGVVGGPANAARAPLLRWLAGAELDLKPGAHAAVFGDTVQFTVPCVKLALKLKESP